MLNKTILLFCLAFLFACSKQKGIPKLKTEKIPVADVIVKDNLQKVVFDSSRYSAQNADVQRQVDDLMILLDKFQDRQEDFNIADFQKEYSQFDKVLNVTSLNAVNTQDWFHINGMLLQLTSEAQYAEEIEEILYTGIPGDSLQINNLVAPYIFTKLVDHVHVNLFAASEIEYEHSLYGKVKIVQETGYSPTGMININFGMEKKRYIELYVRIPSWADGATVTVHNVKYVAHPGEYCLIAKEWKQGDVVEIYFPMANAPDYIKKSIAGKRI